MKPLETDNIIKKLIASHTTVSTMESCTSGLIASMITDTEGASAIFPGGFVTYLNETQAVAFGDKLLTFYSLKNQLKPKTVQEYTVEDEITKVFYGDDQVGVVTVPKEKGAAVSLLLR